MGSCWRFSSLFRARRLLRPAGRSLVLGQTALAYNFSTLLGRQFVLALWLASPAKGGPQ